MPMILIFPSIKSLRPTMQQCVHYTCLNLPPLLLFLSRFGILPGSRLFGIGSDDEGEG